MAYENTFAYKLLQKFETMREKVKHYSAAVDVCPLPAFIATRNGNTVLYVNQAYRRLFGRGEEALQDLNWLAVIHPDDRMEVERSWSAFTSNPQDNVPCVHTHRYLGADGQIIPAVTYSTPVVNNGIVGYIVPATCGGMALIHVDLACDPRRLKSNATLAATA